MLLSEGPPARRAREPSGDARDSLTHRIRRCPRRPRREWDSSPCETAWKMITPLDKADATMLHPWHAKAVTRDGSPAARFATPYAFLAQRHAEAAFGLTPRHRAAPGLHGGAPSHPSPRRPEQPPPTAEQGAQGGVSPRRVPPPPTAEQGAQAVVSVRRVPPRLHHAPPSPRSASEAPTPRLVQQLSTAEPFQQMGRLALPLTRWHGVGPDRRNESHEGDGTHAASPWASPRASPRLHAAPAWTSPPRSPLRRPRSRLRPRPEGAAPRTKPAWQACQAHIPRTVEGVCEGDQSIIVSKSVQAAPDACASTACTFRPIDR